MWRGEGRAHRRVKERVGRTEELYKQLTLLKQVERR
jgi:hypothetical protein